MSGAAQIELDGVRVHNLQNISLRIQRQALTAICGVSGSGKSSLAFDTLYAEGQRRYIETFSPWARQFLQRIERPAADRISGLPPAIAIRQNQRSYGSRSTVGTRTEILDYLRLLFVRVGQVICPDCRIPVTAFTAESAAAWLLQHCVGRRTLIAFPFPTGGATPTAPAPASSQSAAAERTPTTAEVTDQLLQRGFARVLLDDALRRIDELPHNIALPSRLLVVLDRLRVQPDAASRLAESLETALAAGDGECLALYEPPDSADGASVSSPPARQRIDGSDWLQQTFHQHRRCSGCHREFSEPTPEALNFNSAVGACPDCEGTGAISALTLDKVVPNARLSLRDGAVQPWNTPAYQHELQELLALAPAVGLRTDVPFADLTDDERRIVVEGSPAHQFGGLVGFHRWLQRHRYKTGVSVFLNRWRTWSTCPACHGTRLNPTATAVRLHDTSLPEIADRELTQVMDWLSQVLQELSAAERRALQSVVEHLQQRLQFLLDCGLGYLTLNRALRTLSGGEAQRVQLTAALGSGLINTLYILDEPTSGLHRLDTQKVIAAAQRLTTAGNTVVVVEHDPQFLLAADALVEIGPAAGEQGGRVVFQGTPAELLQSAETATAVRLRDYHQRLHSDAPGGPGAPASRGRNRRKGKSGTAAAETATNADSRPERRIPEQWLTVTGVNCHNLKDVSVQLPLGVIAAVTGVSGSGKSSLLVDAIYPELCRLLGRPCSVDRHGTVADIQGYTALDDVLLLDQSPLQKARRSIPVTWIGAFDDIRRLLAESHEARKRNYTAAAFSFNSDRGGRCPACQGLGYITVDMQFLADIETICEECQGRRFRSEILEVRYRDRSVHDILQMTADEAFGFFNGHPRIQQRLNAVRQAGLTYLRLGQPLSTLSGGEAQRLRIAALLAGIPLETGDAAPANRRAARITQSGRTLFLLDEPSTGLHPQDIDQLLTCLQHLVQTGHSVLLIEHDDYLLQFTDYRIELGPGAGAAGGRIISAG